MTPTRARKIREQLGSRKEVAAKINDEFTDISWRTIEGYEQGIKVIPRYYIYFLKTLLTRIPL